MLIARAFVTGMMAFLARGLCAVSRSDAKAREDVMGLPDGFVFEMKVLCGPAVRLKKTAAGLVPDGGDSRPDVSIQLKHLRHAVRLLGFVEGTPLALARSRVIVDGSVAHAMRMQRVMDRMQAILLPRPIAARALKRVPKTTARDAARLIAAMVP
jgi:hypothetical protein